MSQLIKEIQGKFLPNITTQIVYINGINGIVKQEDYINLFGFNAYLQNLSQTQITQALTLPYMFGLPNNSNLKMITLEIDY